MQEKNEISTIVDIMVNSYKKNQIEIDKLKTINYKLIDNPYCSDEKIINNIEINKNQNYKFAATDSGFVNKLLSFSSITIIKEVGVTFSYKDSKLVNTKYYPKIYNLAKPYLTTPGLELEEIMWNTSILRLSKEIELSTSIVGRELNLNFMLLDGSVIPQYINKPTKECKSRKDYDALISKFVDLFNKAREKRCFIAGCIEDCRASRFFKILKEEINSTKNLDFELYDSFVVFSLLNINQRTGVFKYSKNPEEHPILKDFPKEIRNNIYVCYIKLSDLDYPLRIEFIYFKEFGLSLYEFTNKLINNISSISSFSKRYIYPAPLIEADLRSRLRLEEIDLIITRILEKTRAYGFRLPRRESRIF